VGEYYFDGCVKVGCYACYWGFVDAAIDVSFAACKSGSDDVEICDDVALWRYKTLCQM
jgi:hypothetical protein